MRAYRLTVAVLAVVFVGIGLTLIALGASRSDEVRLLLGGLFTALGTARLHLLRKGR